MWKCLLIQALFCSTLFIRNLYWSVFIITISILCFIVFFIVCFKFIFETLLYSALKIQSNAIILEIPQEEQHFFLPHVFFGCLYPDPFLKPHFILSKTLATLATHSISKRPSHIFPSGWDFPSFIALFLGSRGKIVWK